MMGQSVQQGRRHLLVHKHARPFSEAEIGRYDDAGTLIELTDQVEQQGATHLADGQVAQLVEDHQIGVDQAVSQLPLLAGLFLLLQGIDYLDGGQEPDPLPVVLDSLYADGRGQVGLACTRSTYEDNILGVFQEVATV